MVYSCRLVGLLVVAIGVAAPCCAQPSLSLVDNQNGTATLAVVTNAPGAIAAELVIEFSDGVRLIGTPTINDLVFDQPNPGDSPFQAGSPIGGDANGLTFDDAEGEWLFAAFGGADPGIGTFDFVTFEYEIMVPDVTDLPCPRGPGGSGEVFASGVIAQGGVLNAVFSGSTIYGGPLPLHGDPNGDGIVSAADITSVLSNFGSVNPPPGDANCDGLVTAADITAVLSNFGNVAGAASTTVPEPATAVMVLAALSMAVGSRR